MHYIYISTLPQIKNKTKLADSLSSSTPLSGSDHACSSGVELFDRGLPLLWVLHGLAEYLVVCAVSRVWVFYTDDFTDANNCGNVVPTRTCATGQGVCLRPCDVSDGP